jgi:hypothetical protein
MTVAGQDHCQGGDQCCRAAGKSGADERAEKTSEKSNHPAPPKSSCPCCAECPLCAPVTLSPIFRVEVLRQEKITEYAVMPDNPLSDYPEQHWKPPDIALAS